MPDIFHDVPIKAPIDRVLEAVTTPEGLGCWWTKRSKGKPVLATEIRTLVRPGLRLVISATPGDNARTSVES